MIHTKPQFATATQATTCSNYYSTSDSDLEELYESFNYEDGASQASAQFANENRQANENFSE